MSFAVAGFEEDEKCPLSFDAAPRAGHRGGSRSPSRSPLPGMGPASGSLLTRVLDELDYGVMLVDETAQLRFANRAARCALATHPCVQLVDGQVLAGTERAQLSLLKACAAGIGGRRSMVTIRAGGACASIAVVPVNEVDDSGCSVPAVLLVMGRRRACEPLSVEFFAREHRVTTAETSVLKGLCNGIAPIDIAREAGVALSTVRTQIGSLRVKTGARTIADLVRMVTLLPPIVAVCG